MSCNQLLVILLFCISTISVAQDSLPPPKYLSIGSKHFGVAFGNSSEYTGVRINFSDYARTVANHRINGFNFTVFSAGENMNGLQTTLLSSDIDKVNGISIVGINQRGTTINGIGAGFIVDCENLNGIFLGFGIASPRQSNQNKKLHGIAIAPFIAAEKIVGVTLAGKNSSTKFTGISIAIFNTTEELHGIQLGILNHAGNNPGILKWLPFANFHI